MAKKAYIGVDGKARKIKKGYVGVENFVPRALPEGYTQVGYLESSGTQYFDTGFKPNQNTRVVIDFHNFGDYSGMTTSLCPFFGARNASSSAVFAMWIGVKTYPQYGNVVYSKNGYFTTDINRRLLYDFNKNVASIGNDSITCASETFTTDYNLCILTINNYGNIESRRASGKLYSCQIYDNGTLARDFVPCTNSSGVAGLYDMVNAKFYTNAGSGTFVVGSSAQSVARKIRKAYIGIGGVARPCWSGGELAYYGTIDPLSVGRYHLASATAGNHAIFFCGYAKYYSEDKDAYNDSLTKVDITSGASSAKQEVVGTTFGNYAMFGGGYSGSYRLDVHCYDSSLTLQSVNGLGTQKRWLAATATSKHALFGGGYNGNANAKVRAYDTSLTNSDPSNLGAARYHLAATAVGKYALFGGGNNASTVVDAYDTSLTRTTATGLSVGRYQLAATKVGNYALFGGGTSGADTDTVDAYNASLTRTIPSTMSDKVRRLAATSVGDYALFGGGYHASAGYDSKVVTVYDASLTRTTNALSSARSYLAATTVGNYALFGGGYNVDGDIFATVEAFTVA